MANRKKGRKRSSRRSGIPVQPKDFLQHLAGGPALGSNRSIRRAEEYLAAFATYEEWILHGQPEGQLDLTALPPEHHMMILNWPDAFEAYRHALWAYLERNSALNPWSSAIKSLLVRARSSDPTGFKQFIDAVDSASDRYVEQKRNATQDYLRIRDSPHLRERLKLSLHAFAQYYEIDFPMWFLAVLGKSLKTGKLTPSSFGGPNSTVPQGSLIHAATDALKGTPLQQFLTDAFDPDLRNAIQHNDYELVVDGKSVEVRTLDGSKHWDGTRLHQCVTGTAQLVEAVQTVVAYVRLVEEDRQRARFSQAGLVAVMYTANEDELPMATIFQLWCFHEMDAAGTWLDDCTVTFEPAGEGREKVKFTDEGFTVGPTMTDSDLGRVMREQGWMQVIRMPVAPALGLGYPKLEKGLGKASYEIVGVPDQHLVKVRI